MRVNIKAIAGVWDDGYVLDEHILSSKYKGDDEYGKPRFNAQRTEAGEAVFQLKNRGSKIRYANQLVQAINDKIISKFGQRVCIDLITGVASNSRCKAVSLIANELEKLTKICYVDIYDVASPWKLLSPIKGTLIR